MSETLIEEPSESEAKDRLKRYFTESEIETIWSTTLAELSINSEAKLKLEDLEKVFGKLASEVGMVGVFGRSLLIRLRTYKVKQNTRTHE